MLKFSGFSLKPDGRLALSFEMDNAADLFREVDDRADALRAYPVAQADRSDLDALLPRLMTTEAELQEAQAQAQQAQQALDEALTAGQDSRREELDLIQAEARLSTVRRRHETLTRLFQEAKANYRARQNEADRQAQQAHTRELRARFDSLASSLLCSPAQLVEALAIVEALR